MAAQDTRGSWDRVARALHWIVAALLVAQLSIGALIVSLDMYATADVQTYLRWIPTHKSIGLTILVLMVFRVAWRSQRPRPVPLGNPPVWQLRAARINHVLLYALLIVQPLLGLVQSSAYGATTTFWGLFEVPSIVPEAWSRPNTDVVRLAAQDAHTVVAVLLVVSIAVHVGAALWHHFVARDATLVRMLRGASGR